LLRRVETVTQEDSEGHRNPYSTLPSPGNLVLFSKDPSLFVGDAVKLANELVDFAVGGSDFALQGVDAG
jgi:hypothetical protein